MEVCYEEIVGACVDGCSGRSGLRGVGGRRVPRLDPYWRRRLPQLLARFRMQVAAISPGLFKIPLPVSVPEGFQVLRWQDREDRGP